jgi:uncharacterized protein
MKIVVSEIPEGGMWVDFQGSDFAWDGLKGLHVAHYPEGRFFIEKSGTTVFMKGHVTAELRLPCSRCLEEFSFPVDPDVQYTLQPRRPVLDREIELTPEDLEYAYYENDLIDLERLIDTHKAPVRRRVSGDLPHMRREQESRTVRVRGPGPRDGLLCFKGTSQG